MYTSRTGLTLGFHGTDESIVHEILTGKSELVARNNTYDWLGHGIYFWDNSPVRAMEWAIEQSKRKQSSIRKPAVIGAILDLDYCLDLFDFKNLQIVKLGYFHLLKTLGITQEKLPVNRGTEDNLIRELECAVIEAVHELFSESNEKQFDSVRGVFWEGKPLYPNAGFTEKDHIQICVRNIDCIKGYFLPLERVQS